VDRFTVKMTWAEIVALYRANDGRAAAQSAARRRHRPRCLIDQADVSVLFSAVQSTNRTPDHARENVRKCRVYDMVHVRI
jgi:hypothetical protein